MTQLITHFKRRGNSRGHSPGRGSENASRCRFIRRFMLTLAQIGSRLQRSRVLEKSRTLGLCREVGSVSTICPRQFHGIMGADGFTFDLFFRSAACARFL